MSLDTSPRFTSVLLILSQVQFLQTPKLDLRVRPKLGEREVTFCHVTEWIEKKLQDEFQVCFDDIMMSGASL